MARGQGKAITRQAHWPDSRIAVFSPRKWRGDEGTTRGSSSFTSSSRPSPRTRSRSSPPRSDVQPSALAELGQHPALDLARLVDVARPGLSCAPLMGEPSGLRVIA
jgi:hypothetical protein